MKNALQIQSLSRISLFKFYNDLTGELPVGRSTQEIKDELIANLI